LFLKSKAKFLPDCQGNTPLHLACDRGLPRLVKLFIQQGADAQDTNK
jgi:ankyrin repeat protein